MRPALLLTLLLLTSLAAGCGTANPRVRREIALLRGEIVDLENQYYTLKSMYRDDTGREPDFASYGMSDRNRGGGRWLNRGESSSACLECGQVHNPRQEYDHPLLIDSQNDSPTLLPPADSSRPGESMSEPLQEPVIEFEPEEVPLPGGDQSNGFRRPVNQMATEKVNGQAAANSRPVSRSNSPASLDFEIDPSQTRGYDSDGFPGDDGVSVRLLTGSEQTGTGSLGELTVSVIDPELARENQRLGLWKYAPEETAGLIRQDAGGAVVELRLPWQRGPARHENLLLFVRLRTPDGRTIERSASFAVATESTSTDGQGGNSGTPDNDPVIESGSQADGRAPVWKPIR